MPYVSVCVECGLVISKLGRTLGWHEDFCNTTSLLAGERVFDDDTCDASIDGKHVPGFIHS